MPIGNCAAWRKYQQNLHTWAGPANTKRHTSTLMTIRCNMKAQYLPWGVQSDCLGKDAGSSRLTGDNTQRCLEHSRGTREQPQYTIPVFRSRKVIQTRRVRPVRRIAQIYPHVLGSPRHGPRQFEQHTINAVPAAGKKLMYLTLLACQELVRE